MAARPVTHPSADVLRAFALGKLNDPTAEAVMSHLDSCPDCCKQAAALSGDDFLNRLRQAHGRSCTPAPAKPLGDAARAPEPPARQAPIPNLPPELANNPQYEILRELGRGGMGVVYLAKNKLMDRLEVLKVVNKALLDRPGAVERFLREIRSAAKLNHANVVAAYHALQIGELLAFAMEYIEGQDLASLVKSQGPLPIPHACFYLQQAAWGLQHAFEKQMVHRDIKPQNLILAREGRKHIVKVLDFGLAKVMREKKDDTGLTGEGRMLGTPDYIAPEQTLDAAKADIRADIYSLGCTLYYLLSGHPPFCADSLGAMLLAHQMHEARPLNLVRPEVPEELAAVVRKMMAKTPAKRYQTPLQVVEALAPFVKRGGTQKFSPELSSGSMEAKPVVKIAAPVDPPPAPAPEVLKQRPEPTDVWGSLTEDSSASIGTRKSKVGRRPRAATVRERTSRKRWLMGGGIALGALLLALLGMWAGGVFTARVKTQEGILVVEVNEPNPEVFVDGARVTVSWDNGGKKAEIGVKPGTHKIEVKKDGFSVDGTDLTFADGDKVVFTARLLANKPDEQEKREAKAVVQPEMPPKPDGRPVDTPPRTTPHNDYDELAKGRWVPVLPSVAEFNQLLAKKTYRGTEPKYVGDRLECNGFCRLFFPSIQAKDIIVRGRMKLTEPKEGCLGFFLRNADGEAAVARYDGDGTFALQRGSGQSWKYFESHKLSEPYAGYFEFAFALVGDRLFAYANGRKILEARDDARLDRPVIVEFGTTGNCSGCFRNIEAQILDKPLADERGSDAGKADPLALATKWTGLATLKDNTQLTAAVRVVERSEKAAKLTIEFENGAIETFNCISEGSSLRITGASRVRAANPNAKNLQPLCATTGEGRVDESKITLNYTTPAGFGHAESGALVIAKREK